MLGEVFNRRRIEIFFSIFFFEKIGFFILENFIKCKTKKSFIGNIANLIINLSSAEFIQRVVKVKVMSLECLY